MKKPLSVLSVAFIWTMLQVPINSLAQTTVIGSRMGEVFKESILHGTVDASLGAPFPAANLNNPWEILYGPDHFLWITEAKGYKVRRLDPSTGSISTVLDIANGASGYLTPTEHTNYNRQFGSGQNPWPQGGMMGLALHPDFMAASNPKNYVYVAYVFSYDGVSGTTDGGYFFTNKLVRFTYNTSNNRLESPVSLCDTLPGSNDHNSGRMIIAPVGGTYYLFYGSGDMGAGQYSNKQRVNHAQNSSYYEGKVLRFNLEQDGDAGTYDRWIPSGTGLAGNPFNGARQSAVYTIGVRNNQGFAYDPVNDILYGSEHGPFSDDEVNIVERGMNYGHPLVIGYNDGNYNNVKAGSSSSVLPFISSESTEASNIGSSFRQSMYSLYPAANGPSGTANTVLNIYNSTTGDPGGNLTWKSVAGSGLDIYRSTKIPGWKNSLLLASLKKGKVFRLKLDATGTGVDPTPSTASSPTNDTVGLFFSQNRFRDIAFSPGGDTIFVAIDKDGTTSGPTTGSGANYSECPGCIKRYIFLGYADNSGTSSIPTGIPIETGTAGICQPGDTIVINDDNKNLWVPITGPNGNIVAEIKANNNDLGTIVTSFYKNSGTVREDASNRLYLDRNITITPQFQPTTPVSIRLYITAPEFNSLSTANNSLGQPSNVAAISNLGIFKNNDGCGASINSGAAAVATTAKVGHGSWGYVLQANVSSFSSFYFGNVANSTLPTELISFTGSLNNNDTKLSWVVASDATVSKYVLERSLTGSDYSEISTVLPLAANTNYSFTDAGAANLPSLLLYYRLKMIDRDGSFKYSGIITVSLSGITRKMYITPNPSSGGNTTAVVIAPQGGKAQWRIMDNAGRVIAQSNISLRAGYNNIPLPVDGMAGGIYYLSITGAAMDQKVMFRKF